MNIFNNTLDVSIIRIGEIFYKKLTVSILDSTISECESLDALVNVKLNGFFKIKDT